MENLQPSAGKTIKTITRFSAFVPNPLPPPFKWSTDLVNSLSRADYVLGKLALEGSKLPNPLCGATLRLHSQTLCPSRLRSSSTFLTSEVSVELSECMTIAPNKMIFMARY